MKKNNHSQNSSKLLEKIKWLSISTFFILSFFIHHYFYQIALFIRICILSFLIICAITTFSFTKQGKCLFAYIKMSKKEMEKIIWPKYKETLYTTLIVITVTIFMSLLLWILDSIIFRSIAFIISLRF